MEIAKVLERALDGPLIGYSLLCVSEAKGIQQLIHLRGRSRLSDCLQGKDTKSLDLRSEVEEMSAGLRQQRSLSFN